MDRRDIRLWVIVPLILMALLNIGFWFAYVEDQTVTSTAKELKIPTLWGYFQSDIFKAIIGSLVIPIFMFLFNEKFKIVENYQASRAEKSSQLIKENRERRWETIKNTLAMWNNLDKLASEIVYFEKSHDDIDRIKELQKRIDNFPSEAEDVISEWYYRFPNLSDGDTMLLLVHHINNLLEPIRTVASFIEDDLDKKDYDARDLRHTGLPLSPDTEALDKKDYDARDLRLSLNIIRNGIRYSVHQNLISILKESLDLLDVIEDNNQEIISTIDNVNDLINELPDEEKVKGCKIKGKIEDKIKNLNEWDKSVFSTIQPYWEILPNANNEEETEYVEEYSKAYMETRSEFEKDPSYDNYYKTQAYMNFGVAYSGVSHELHMKASRYDLTRDGIKALADWFNQDDKVNLAHDEASLVNKKTV